MANATDGTTVNAATVAGGDTISTEDMPVGAARGSADLPLTDYKLGRSKIALGDYGKDTGDVSAANPLPVVLSAERRLFELNSIHQADNLRYAQATRHRERMSFGDRMNHVDRRGPGGR